MARLDIGLGLDQVGNGTANRLEGHLRQLSCQGTAQATATVIHLVCPRHTGPVPWAGSEQVLQEAALLPWRRGEEGGASLATSAPRCATRTLPRPHARGRPRAARAGGAGAADAVRES